MPVVERSERRPALFIRSLRIKISSWLEWGLTLLMQDSSRISHRDP